MEHEDMRRDYGEPRYLVTGEVDGPTITVVWTPRGNRRRIISGWPASNRERRDHARVSAALEALDSGVFI